MTAAMLVLEPIFEADLPLELYAYRPGRNAQQAVVEVEELLFRGHPEVVDADLADYFGSIPHAELLKSVSRRIVDRRVLHLIRMWLDCPRVVSGAEFHDAASNRRPIEPVGDLSRAIWAHNSARLIPSILIAPIDGEARAMQDHADRASLGAPELSGGVAVPCSAASVPATA